LLIPFSKVLSWRKSFTFLRSFDLISLFWMIQSLIFLGQLAIVFAFTIQWSSFEQFISCFIQRFWFEFVLISICSFSNIFLNSKFLLLLSYAKLTFTFDIVPVESDLIFIFRQFRNNIICFRNSFWWSNNFIVTFTLPWF
jgi:hypothetical protein